MMTPQNMKKKVDSLGRVTIPVGIRRRMGIIEGDEMKVFTCVENGKEYICFLLEDAIPEERESAV